MPLAGVQQAAKDYHDRKAAAESGGYVWFNLEDGQEATIRFLEEGDSFTTFWVHRLPQQGSRFPQVPCLDQSPKPSGRIACPGCEEGHKRSFRFAVNVIHRNAPVPKRDKENNNRIVKDSNNKVVYTDQLADQVKVWTGGIQVAEDLDHLDGKFGGLTSRDFDIQRSGVKLDTKWRILPAGDRQPLTPKDQELVKGKFDLNQLKKPPEYDEFYSYGGANAGAAQSGGSAPTAASQSVRQSPFQRRNVANGG